MSSKTLGQQQGRRTPLSLASGKSNHQNHSNKTNQGSYNNVPKNQETKDLTRQNGNNNNPKDSNVQQKDNKKTQPNGNKQNNNVANAEHSQKGNGNQDVVEVQHGTSNGNSNGVAIKNVGSKSSAQPTTKETKEKEKLKDKEKETVKEGHKEKSKKSDGPKPMPEKTQNEIQEKNTEQCPSPKNSHKSKDEGINPAVNAPVVSNEKKQNTTSSSGKTKNANTESKVITPTKSTEKGSATPPSNTSAIVINKVATPPLKETLDVPATDNEVDMEPINLNQSPPKKTKRALPAATSTPGKFASTKSETQLTLEDDGSSSPDPSSVPRTFSQISGRRGIRNTGDYTPSMYNPQFRESYRRINTELDVTSNTNTSMNVTVGSEVPNNSSFLSFSLFGRSRKRERTPPGLTLDKSLSSVEQTLETTPPKRARLDMHSIFTTMSSPLTLLRSRFSKTAIDDTPAKVQQEQENKSDTDDVQNVSGVSIDEVPENTATEDITIGEEVITIDNSPAKSADTVDKPDDVVELLQNGDDIKKATANDMDINEDGDIKFTETPLIPAVGEPKGKHKGCIVM